MDPYTVVLMYPPYVSEGGESATHQSYIAWVKANRPALAKRLAQKEVAFSQSPRRRMRDFDVVAVFRGWHDDVDPALPRLRKEKSGQ